MKEVLKKIVLTGLVLFEFLGLAGQALAQAGGPSLPPGAQLVPQLQEQLQSLADKAETKADKKMEDILLDLGAVLYKNTLGRFLAKLAKETATWIASGDKGQKPLLFTSGWKDYLQEAGESAVGDIIDKLGADFGINLCVPPTAVLKIGLGIKQAEVPGPPKCKFKDLVQNWDVTREDFMDNYTAQFSPEGNELGLFLDLNIKKDEAKAEKQRIAALKRQPSNPVEDIRDKISDTINTPGDLAYDSLKGSFDKQTQPAFEFTARPIADAVNVFVSTLASQGLKRLQEGLVSKKQKSPANFSSQFGGASKGKEFVEKSYQKSFNNPIKLLGEYNLLQEFAACPDDKRLANPANCVVDTGLLESLTASGEDSNLTVREAMEKGLLNPDWPFGYINPGAGVEPDITAGYPHSAMIKLRRARIVPIGWEIAAERIRQDGKPSTLRQVVDSFDDPGACREGVCLGGSNRGRLCNTNALCPGSTCGDQGVCSDNNNLKCFSDQDCNAGANCQPPQVGRRKFCGGLAGSETLTVCAAANQPPDDEKCKNPFYHLVDPDWVLKAPKYLCRASVPGQIIQAGTNKRKDYCGDIQDCVVEDSEGKSCLAWGYCTREKNTWRFTGESCQSMFSSCRTLVRKIDSQEFNLLTNTLDRGNCNAGNAGCLWYSRAQNLRGDWLDDRRIYLNRTASKCEQADAGCREFYVLTNLKNSLTPEEVVKQVLASPTKNDTYQNYASVNSVYLKGTRLSCLFDEAGCDTFEPANGDPKVNGVATDLDRCPKECVGYNAFKQEATFLERARPQVLFIPQTAVSCQPADVGCDQFTNLDKTEAGGEEIEYYSYLRQCQKPATDCAVFYTWEGSEDSGFQLRSFNLKATNPDGTGAPKTTDGSTDCGDRKSPECKQFYDANGNTYFRDFKKTITCSDRCFRYRMTTTTQDECQASNGNWLDNKCVYQAIPEQGIKCSAAANGCREFKGNLGENVAKLIETNFESGGREGWSLGVISNEALQAPGRSLKFNGRTELDVSKLVQNGRSYMISFWIKTAGLRANTISAKLGAPGANNDLTKDLLIGQTVKTNDVDWSQVTVGPLLTNRDILADERLILTVSQESYIDNILFREVRGQIFAVKNSWKTPLSCDTNPPLPGGTGKSSALGCKEYRNRKGVSHFLKSFSRLCSADKVGCQAMIDTQNSLSPYEQVINKDVGGPGRQPNPANVRSEITVPADRVVYVVNDDKKYCQPDKKGCSALGRPNFNAADQITGFDTVYKIDNPDTYQATLCKAEHLFCEEYDNNESLSYFKHPGPKICEYRAVANTNPVRYAWFKVGSDALSLEGDPECQEADKNDWAKSCPPDQNLCTEFLEPITQASFYYLKNDQLDTSSCNGIIDWKKGCVLFDDTSNPVKTFTSYSEDKDRPVNTSMIKGVPPVNCVTNGTICDTNLLLKVRRDRTCSEWLACQSSAQVYDIQRNELRNVCYGIGRCIKARADNLSECQEWVTDPYKTCDGGPNANLPCKNKFSCGCKVALQNGRCPFDSFYECKTSPLTDLIYKDRDVSFIGKEFSGFSLPDKYPVERYKQVVYDRDQFDRPVFGLSYFRKTGAKCNAGKCVEGQICINKDCYIDMGLDGSNVKDLKAPKEAQRNGVAFKQCRGYPESESPFPYSLATYDEDGNVTARQPGFDKANLAQKGENVDCRYKKVLYDNGSYRYVNEASKPSPEIVHKGQNYGVSLVDEYFGWRGYCLEKDFSKVINGDTSQSACYTWYPVDLLAGDVDLYNNFPSAGYVVAPGKNYYCAESKLMEYRARFRIGNTDGSGIFGPDANILWVNPAFAGMLTLANLFLDNKSCEQTFGKTCQSNGYVVQRAGSFSCGITGSSTCYRCDCVPVDREMNTREGWYQFDGPFAIEATRPPRQVCTKIVRIEGDQPGQENKAWTSRVQLPYEIAFSCNIVKGKCSDGPNLDKPCKSDSDCGVISTNFSFQSLGFERRQDNNPFGVIKPPRVTEPSDWVNYKDEFGNSIPVRVVRLSEVTDKPLEACPNSEPCIKGRCGGRITGITCTSAIAECKDSECTTEGVCKDGPEAGKECISPKAGDAPIRSGSPLALNALGTIGGETLSIPAGQISAKTVIGVRNMNSKQPYKGVERADQGYDRLKSLFARAYGVWDWEVGNNICAGRCKGSAFEDLYCVGGSKDGAPCTFEKENDNCGPGGRCTKRNIFCLNDNSCDIDLIKKGVVVNYTCTEKVCVGGFNAGKLCNSDFECQSGAAFCGSEGLCLGGKSNGKACKFDADCPADLSGTCGDTGASKKKYCGDAQGVGTASGSVCFDPVKGGPETLCRSVGQCVLDICTDGNKQECDSIAKQKNCGENEENCRRQVIGEACGAKKPLNGYRQIKTDRSWNITVEGVCNSKNICEGGLNDGFSCKTNKDCPAVGELPDIHPTLYNARTRQYSEDARQGVSLNFSAQGTVFGRQSKSVAMQFYAYNANGEQMPIREITVDWDDGGEGNTYSVGSFKNHKHYCKKPSDPPDDRGYRYNFGDTSDACIGDSNSSYGFFTFVHVYICKPNDPGWQAYKDDGTCQFKPRVVIKDNWGKERTAFFGGTPDSGSGIVVVTPD